MINRIPCSAIDYLAQTQHSLWKKGNIDTKYPKEKSDMEKRYWVYQRKKAFLCLYQTDFWKLYYLIEQ